MSLRPNQDNPDYITNYYFYFVRLQKREVPPYS